MFSKNVFEGLVWCHIRLILSLHHKWALICISAAQLYIQLPNYDLRKQQRMGQVLGSLHPHGKTEGSFWFLASNISTLSVWPFVGEPTDERLLSLFFLLSKTFLANKNK